MAMGMQCVPRAFGFAVSIWVLLVCAGERGRRGGRDGG